MELLKDNGGSPLDEKLLDDLSKRLARLLEGNSNTDHASQKAWLLETAGSIPVKERDKLRFLDHARKIPAVLSQTLMLIALSDPASLGHVLRHEGLLLKRFFFENPAKIPAWFQFRFSEENQHGAQALERYLFDHRDTAWDSLVWRSRGHPPVVVVHRKNLLMEIDVEKTMRHFLYQEEFWRSTHMQEVMRQGSFLQLDYQFFLRYLESVFDPTAPTAGTALAKRLDKLLENYFLKEPLRTLCQQLLPLFPDTELLGLLHHLSSRPLTQLKFRLLTEPVWPSLSEVSFLHTLLERGPAVLRLVQESQNAAALGVPNDLNFAPALAHLRTLRPSALLLRLPLLVFVLAWRLSSLHESEEAWADFAEQNQLPLAPVRVDSTTYRKSHKKHKKKRKKVEQIVGWKMNSVLLSTAELPYAVASFLLQEFESAM